MLYSNIDKSIVQEIWNAEKNSTEDYEDWLDSLRYSGVWLVNKASQIILSFIGR